MGLKNVDIKNANDFKPGIDMGLTGIVNQELVSDQNKRDLIHLIHIKIQYFFQKINSLRYILPTFHRPEFRLKVNDMQKFKGVY